MENVLLLQQNVGVYASFINPVNSEKLDHWLKYAWTHFPDSLLFGIADDDVYICPEADIITFVQNNRSILKWFI